MTTHWMVVSHGTAQAAARLCLQLEGVIDRVHLICTAPGEADHAAQELRERNSATTEVHDCGDNPGYLPSAARIFATLPDLPELLVISNADLELVHCDIHALLMAAGAPGVLMLAPQIHEPDGNDQNPHLLRAPKATKLAVLAALFSSTAVANLISAVRKSNRSRQLPASAPRSEGVPMFASHGSCLVFSREYFTLGGEIDYPFFLFGEELWCGSEVARLGGSIRYTRALAVQHHAHASTGSGARYGRVAASKGATSRYWGWGEGRRRLDRVGR